MFGLKGSKFATATPAIRQNERRLFQQPLFLTAVSLVTVLAVVAAVFFIRDSQQRSDAREIDSQYQGEIAKATSGFNADGVTVERRYQIWTSLDALSQKADREANKYVDVDSSFKTAFVSFQNSFDKHYTDLYKATVVYPVKDDVNYRAQIATFTASVATIDAMLAEQGKNKAVLDMESLETGTAFLDGERIFFNDAASTANVNLQASISAVVANYEAVIASNSADASDAATYQGQIAALDALKVVANANLDLVGADTTNAVIARIDAVSADRSAKIGAITAAQAQARAAASSAAKKSPTGSSSSSSQKSSSGSASTGSSGGQHGVVRNPDGSTYVGDITKWCDMFGCTAG